MTLIYYKLIAAILIFFTSFVTIIYPLKSKKKSTATEIGEPESFELGEALASGIFLGVGFFHMLPNAITSFQKLYSGIQFPIPEAIMVGAFLLLVFLERLSFSSATVSPKKIIPYVLTLILIIHSLTEGAALGIGSSVAESMIIFIAIMAHKSSASFALCVTLMRYQLSLSHIITIMILFSLMTPIGIGFGAIISLHTQSAKGELISAIFDAFAAGTFLYISTLHHVRFHQRAEEAHALLEYAFLAAGLIAMGVIAAWV